MTEMKISKVREIVAQKPKPLSLFDEVHEYFGEKLSFAEVQGTISTYTHQCDAQHLKFHRAKVDLAVNTDRVVAAITHELLHFRLSMDGFPIIRSINPGTIPREILPDISDTLNKALNVVQHDAFIDKFLACDLPLSQFLGPPTSAEPNYKKQWKDQAKFPTPPSLMFIWWNWWMVEYLRHFISIEHGGINAAREAEKVETWGKKALPGFSKEAARLRDWIARGAHKSKDTYASAVGELMQIMRLPPISSFYGLRRLPDGSVEAIAFP